MLTYPYCHGLGRCAIGQAMMTAASPTLSPLLDSLAALIPGLLLALSSEASLSSKPSED